MAQNVEVVTLVVSEIFQIDNFQLKSATVANAICSRPKVAMTSFPVRVQIPSGTTLVLFG